MTTYTNEVQWGWKLGGKAKKAHYFAREFPDLSICGKHKNAGPAMPGSELRNHVACQTCWQYVERQNRMTDESR